MSQEIVTIFDGGLSFVAGMNYSPERLVLKVSHGDTPYVLKAFPSDNPYFNEHIDGEVRALTIAQSLDGITKLVNDYGSQGGFRAILKEYRQGQDLYQRGPVAISSSLQQRLRDTVAKLHKFSLCDLDISPKNVVITPDDEDAVLIDLGSAKHRSVVSRDGFQLGKAKDRAYLEGLFT
ncbi:hypothetical protein COV20_02735 [Candidatus Woesearchaeota archaeon CG10_big_fil_rev_8_21_14_0_10_45_16]|nr:MAG: hypothetical protein COV20_02735 [Candidatus Woesearchaeota archaeon CG10_big_fil_rev_8_21_14_0_10_45_16]